MTEVVDKAAIASVAALSHEENMIIVFKLRRGCRDVGPAVEGMDLSCAFLFGAVRLILTFKGPEVTDS
jgi:hypothetical protein